jgi:hypothetical protein
LHGLAGGVCIATVAVAPCACGASDEEQRAISAVRDWHAALMAGDGATRLRNADTRRDVPLSTMQIRLA